MGEVFEAIVHTSAILSVLIMISRCRVARVKFQLGQDLGLWMELDHHTVNPREARVGTKISNHKTLRTQGRYSDND